MAITCQRNLGTSKVTIGGWRCLSTKCSSFSGNNSTAGGKACLEQISTHHSLLTRLTVFSQLSEAPPQHVLPHTRHHYREATERTVHQTWHIWNINECMSHLSTFFFAGAVLIKRLGLHARLAGEVLGMVAGSRPISVCLRFAPATVLL